MGPDDDAQRARCRQLERRGIERVGGQPPQRRFEEERNDGPVDRSEDGGAAERVGDGQPRAHPCGRGQHRRQQEGEEREQAQDVAARVGESQADRDAHRERQRGGASGHHQGGPPGADVELELSCSQGSLEGKAREGCQQDESDRAGHRPSDLFTLSSSASES